MQQWEYLRLQTENSDIRGSDDKMAELGRQGWELVSVIEAGSSFVHFWFRRPIGVRVL